MLRFKPIHICVLLVLISAFFIKTTYNQFISSTFALDAIGIEVFWDESCTQKVQSINWDVLTPGSERDVRLYLWNRMEEPVFICVWTKDWNPSMAWEFITLFFNHEHIRNIVPDETTKVTLILRVSPQIRDITDFSFTIVFEGLAAPRGDINRDRIVDISDIVIVTYPYGSTPSDDIWNAAADLDQDQRITMLDLVTVINDFGILY